MLHGEEWMFLVGMDHLARLRGGFAVLSTSCGDGQVHQVVVVVDPHMQDGLLFHLARLGVVGQHSFTYLQGADGLLAVIGGDTGLRREAQWATILSFCHQGFPLRLRSFSRKPFVR